MTNLGAGSGTLPEKNFLVGVHAFRGLAALLVVCVHAAVLLRWVNPGSDEKALYIGHWFRAGGCGVQFFFVLSGFIIYYVHGRDERNEGARLKFLKKRFLRVFPAYWIILFIAWVTMLIVPSWMPQIGRTFPVFLANFCLIPQREGMAVSVAWTLCHEMLFYGIFLILFYHTKKWWVYFFGWSLVCVIYGGWVRIIHGGAEWSWLNFLTNVNNSLFALGMLTAWISQQWSKGRLLALLVGSALFLGVYVWSNSKGLIRDFEGLEVFGEQLMFGVAFSVLIYGATCINKNSFLNAGFFRLLGDASCSVYLVHLFFQSIFVAGLARIVALAQFPNVVYLTLVGGSVVMGVLFHRNVETVLLRKLRFRA